MRIFSRGLATAALVGFVWHTLAMAEDSPRPAVAVHGRAPAVCMFSQPEAGQASNMMLGAASVARSMLNINRLTDPATAQLRTASITVTSKGVCNHPHVLTITTKNGGLQTPTSPRGFANHVNYTATVSWGASVSQLQTSGIPGQTTPNGFSIGAYLGDMQIQISISQDGASNLPLVAGAYTDDLTITLQPRI